MIIVDLESWLTAHHWRAEIELVNYNNPEMVYNGEEKVLIFIYKE